MATQTFFNPALYNDPKTIGMQRKFFLDTELGRNGMEQYRCKKIRDMSWLYGIAKDLDTVGCMTVREINGRDDIAVYPCLSLREVINSFKMKDSVAAANAIYTTTIKDAARILRSYK